MFGDRWQNLSNTSFGTFQRVKGRKVNGFCLKYLFSRISCVGDTGCEAYDIFNTAHYQLGQPQDFCCGIAEWLHNRFNNL